jgi:hypothetical protein
VFCIAADKSSLFWGSLLRGFASLLGFRHEDNERVCIPLAASFFEAQLTFGLCWSHTYLPSGRNQKLYVYEEFQSAMVPLGLIARVSFIHSKSDSNKYFQKTCNDKIWTIMTTKTSRIFFMLKKKTAPSPCHGKEVAFLKLTGTLRRCIVPDHDWRGGGHGFGCGIRVDLFPLSTNQSEINTRTNHSEIEPTPICVRDSSMFAHFYPQQWLWVTQKPFLYVEVGQNSSILHANARVPSLWV